jgi:hypothetical protein
MFFMENTTYKWESYFNCSQKIVVILEYLTQLCKTYNSTMVLPVDLPFTKVPSLNIFLGRTVTRSSLVTFKV